MSEKLNFLIVGLTRNCETSIKKTIKHLQNVFSPLGAVSFYIVESDSEDKSVEVMEKIKTENKNFDYTSMGNLRNSLPQRTARLAECRNHYLNIIKKDPKYYSTNYVVIADLDGVCNLLTTDAIRSSFESTVHWDVCTANQSGPYYDIWALRHPTWNPTDCWKQYSFLEPYLGRTAALHSAIYSKMLTIPPESPWIEVDSAFGGLGIYKKEAFLNGTKYIGIDQSGDQVCEHVSFHQSLKSSGHKIYINPSLVNTNNTEHSRTLYHLVLMTSLRKAKLSLEPMLKLLRLDIARNSQGKFRIKVRSTKKHSNKK